MKNINYIIKGIAALVAAVLLSSCGGEKSGPETFEPRITAASQQVTSAKGSFFVDVVATGAWTLELTYGSGASDWASLAQVSGNGSKAAILFSYEANGVSAPRTVTITLKNGSMSPSVTITQAAFVTPKWLELPETPAKDGFRFFSRKMTVAGKPARNYAYWWDYKNLVSSWVAYPLNNSLIGTGTRSDAWALDPLLKEDEQPVLLKGYKKGSNGSLYDRGHQIPSADRLTREANEATFYGTNMTPQNNDFNSGIWSNLEDRVRTWSKKCDTLYVVTGCTVEGSSVYCLDNNGKKVTVPTGYYKALLRYSADETTGIGGFMGCAFYLEHDWDVKTKGSTIKKTMAMSIDDLEKKLGIDLFVNLPSRLDAAKADQIEAADPQKESWWW